MNKIGKFLKISVAVLCIALVCFVNIAPAFATSGFDTDKLSEEEQEGLKRNCGFYFIESDPGIRSFDNMDVNTHGMIAVCLDNPGEDYVFVYSSDGEFKYGYRYETLGASAVLWDGDVLMVYLVRGGLLCSLDDKGNVLEIERVLHTQRSNSFYYEIKKRQKSVDGYTYKAGTDLGFWDIFAQSCSQIVRVDSEMNEQVIYDASESHRPQVIGATVFMSMVITVFASVIIWGLLKAVKNAKRDDINKLLKLFITSNKGTVYSIGCDIENSGNMLIIMEHNGIRYNIAKNDVGIFVNDKCVCDNSYYNKKDKNCLLRKMTEVICNEIFNI